MWCGGRARKAIGDCMVQWRDRQRFCRWIPVVIASSALRKVTINAGAVVSTVCSFIVMTAQPPSIIIKNSFHKSWFYLGFPDQLNGNREFFSIAEQKFRLELGSRDSFKWTIEWISFLFSIEKIGFSMYTGAVIRWFQRQDLYSTKLSSTDSIIVEFLHYKSIDYGYTGRRWSFVSLSPPLPFNQDLLT